MMIEHLFLQHFVHTNMLANSKSMHLRGNICYKHGLIPIPIYFSHICIQINAHTYTVYVLILCVIRDTDKIKLLE